MIARPRLVDPNMDLHSGIVRRVDRRGGGAPIDRCEPAGIAVGEHVDRLASASRGNRRHQIEAVAADCLIDRDILVANRGSAL